ncbi:MAG: GxxExxY protein [Chryseolinea sp.]
MDIEIERRREKLNIISGAILASSIEVHRQMGPGLLESIYKHCLISELRSRNICVDEEVPVKLYYKSQELDKIFRIDLLVEREIIIELKAEEGYNALYEAQLLSYLKLADKRLGFIINFHVPLLKQGFKRMVSAF